MSEQTYRNPLFGQRVDRYIPPELRQGIGALLAGVDMLNPVSAYREYLKAAREGDVAGAATNLAGFVAPGVASALASRLGRVGIRGVEPYSDDAARALMEMLYPTGAPDVPRGPMEMSRREFMSGLGAVGAGAATARLPVDEMLGGLGRAGARGGGRAVDELLGLLGRRLEISREWDDAYDVIERRGQNTAGQNGRLYRHDREYTSAVKAANDMYGKMMDEVEQEFFNRVSSSDITQKELESLSNEALRSLADVVAKGPLAKEAGGPELAERIYGVIASKVRSDGVDEFGFVPDDFGVLPRMVGGVEDFGRGLGSVRMPSAEASQRTQIAGTFPTYEKAVRVFDEVAPEGRSLDYGAGLGKSSELGFDTFEPFAREGFDPTYRVSSDIPDASYERVTNLNVLNVLDPETRRGVVLDIGRVLKPDGVAVITTRGRDVLTAKGERGPEDMSVITTAGTYQKGFTKPELVSYLRDTLGDGFEVKSLNLGPAGALVRKLPVTRPD